MIQNKYIIRLSFIGLFLNIVANIVLYRYFMIEEVILKQVADQNIHLAEVYKNSIWDTNPSAVSRLKKENYTKLLQQKDFIKFAQDSSNFLKETTSVVTLYDKDGNKFLTNTEAKIVDVDKHNSQHYYDKILLHLDKYFLQSYISDQALSESFRGRTVHSLVSRAIITDEQNNLSEKSFISSYIPIIDSSYGSFNIEGMLEITTDITEQWDNITYLEKRIFISFIIVFLVFFIIVMYNTNYAQRIINKQFETNRSLEEAKHKAEMESSAKTDFLANISHRTQNTSKRYHWIFRNYHGRDLWKNGKSTIQRLY